MKTIKIVITENGNHGGKGFNVYMEGDTDRIGKVHDEKLSPAEYWGSKLFKICTDVLIKCGAIDTVHRKDN